MVCVASVHSSLPLALNVYETVTSRHRAGNATVNFAQVSIIVIIYSSALKGTINTWVG